MIDKLLSLGFKKVESYNGGMAYLLEFKGNGDRFSYDFAFYPCENKMYINAWKSSGLRTVGEIEVLENHNNLNTLAKEKWLEIKHDLKDFEFDICSGY